MKKLKIYLDTSVISHLNAPDTPDKQADTRKLWDMVKADEFEICISPVVLTELDACPEPKRTELLERLGEVKYTELGESEEVLSLTAQYLKVGILRPKSLDDCKHIAYACVYNCDMITSWNFKHLVNYKTISGVKSVNALAGYREMPIYSPTMLIGGDVEDGT